MESSRKIPWPKVIIALAVLAIAVTAMFIFPVVDYLTKALDWVHSLEFWAPIAFIGIYIIAVVFFVPGSLLTLGAGTLFGVFWGTVYVSIASTVGATLAFLIGRYIARESVEKAIAGKKSFSAIDNAVAQQGWKIVGLTRLSPVFPFTLLNYGYGITPVKLSHYILASWIGMLPGTIMYVYIGSLGKAAANSGDKSPAQWALYGVGLIATIVVTVFITKIAKKALSEKIETAEELD